ncbi:uncharacterized protein VK521_003384 [Ammospiza maritima maritima]
MALTEGTATTHTQAQGMPGTQAMPTLTGTPAPTMEVLQKVAASPKQVQATVRDILWRLASCVTVDGGLHMEILSMTEEHPAQVVMSLLRCAPTCDRATTVMWRAMGTSRVAAQEVFPALLSAMEEQPPYGSFSCGDNKAVLALAASFQALLCAARFLRRRDLEELLTEERRMKFAESLLLQDESRVAEHLRWALPHLQSPQRPLREAAVRFIGVAGVLMMGQKEELQVLTEALQALKEDESPSCMSKVLQMTFERRCAGLCSSAGSDLESELESSDPVSGSELESESEPEVK